MADTIRKSGRRRRWTLCASNLATLTHDSTYISIVIDMFFINRKLNMIKWLQFPESPTGVSNPYIFQSVRNLRIQFRFTWNFQRKFRTSLKKCSPSFVTLSYELQKLWWIHFEWRFFWCTVCIYISISIYIYIYLYLYLSISIYLYLYIYLNLFIIISNECAIILKCSIL